MTAQELLVLAATIAFGFVVAVAFYESLSTRDVLVRRVMRLARRISARSWFVGAAYVLCVGVGIPILVLTWAVVLEIALFVIGSVDRIGSVAAISVAVVAAARMLAYVREKTAHELAKAIPLALAFALLTGGAFNLEAKAELFVERPEITTITSDMVVFLLVLELGLRILTDGGRTIRGAVRRRSAGSATSAGSNSPPA